MKRKTKKCLYIEGPQARENFERRMSAIFQIPKSETMKKVKKAKKGKD